MHPNLFRMHRQPFFASGRNILPRIYLNKSKRLIAWNRYTPSANKFLEQEFIDNLCQLFWAYRASQKSPLVYFQCLWWQNGSKRIYHSGFNKLVEFILVLLIILTLRGELVLKAILVILAFPVILASTITRNHLVICVIPTQDKHSAHIRSAEQIN